MFHWDGKVLVVIIIGIILFVSIWFTLSGPVLNFFMPFFIFGSDPDHPLDPKPNNRFSLLGIGDNYSFKGIL